MTILKFSHTYDKMPRDYKLSKLLDVLPVKLENLSPDFRQYDTSYLDGGEGKNYSLPAKGDYMILLLQAGSGCGQLWTTIRSQRGSAGLDKLGYYRGKIGEILECVVT